MKRLLLALCLSMLCPSFGLAQQIKYQNVVISTGGVPFPTVRVCTEPATGTPCTPLASNIYSDPGGSSPLTNPFTGDANGNFTFYANPGLTYHVQISALGIVPYDIPYITLPGNGGGSSFYQTIQANGTTQTQRPIINYIAGAGITFNCVDNSGLTRTDCTITSTGGGTGNVNTAPSGAQNIVQNIQSNQTTQFSANNFANSRYVTASFNWSVQPGGSYTGGVGATLTFANCPAGVSGADTNLYVYISGGTGTAEPVLITGGTCTPGLASGTLTFTPVNSHSGAFSVGSASTGIYEAYKDATFNNANNAHIVTMPSNPPGTGYVYSVYAPITLTGGELDIDGVGGTTLDCQATRACFVITSTSSTAVHVHGFRVGTKSSLNAFTTSTAITNVACASNVSTITATFNPLVGSMVDIQGTFNPHFWGPHIVVSSSPSSFTFADTNCGGPGTIASQASAGGVAYQFAFVEDNGGNTHIDHIDFNPPGTGGFSARAFNNAIVVLNDQAFRASNLNVSGLGGCTANYCATAIYAPGPFATNAAVIWIDHSQISMQCSGNGVTDYAGNTLSISDTVIQGTEQWGVVSGTLRGGFGPTTYNNVYNEVGSCTNPKYPGAGAAQQANAGLLLYGSYATVRGGEGPIGQLPKFAATGNQGTQYDYYLVVHDSVLGVSLPLWCGVAAVDSVTPTGTITVACPRVTGSNTITYDVVRTTGAGASRVFPSTSVCTGGSTSACGSVLLAQAQCATSICSFTDNAAASTASYTVSTPAFYPTLNFWPGGVILDDNGDTTNVVNAASYLIADDSGNFVTNLSPITVIQNQMPSIRATACTAAVQGINAVCIAGTPVGNNNPQNVGTLLMNGGVTGGDLSTHKGRLNFWVPVGSSGLVNSEIITLVDSNAAKTIGSAFYRPLPDAADAYIAMDQGSPASNGIGYGATLSQSWYINSLPDGASYLMRLTSNLLNIKVNTTVNGNFTVTGSCSGCGLPTFAVDQAVIGTGTGTQALFSLPQGALAYNLFATTTQGFYQAGCVDLSNGCSGTGNFVLQNNATIIGATLTNPTANNLTISGGGTPSQFDFTFSGTGCNSPLASHTYVCMPSASGFTISINGGNAFTPGPSSAIITNLCGGTVGAASATAYIMWPAQQSTTTCTSSALSATTVEVPIAAAGTLQNMYCSLNTGGASGDAITLYKNNAAATLTIPIGATTSGNDTTHKVPVVAGDTFSVRYVTNTTSDTAAGIRCTFEYVRTP